MGGPRGYRAEVSGRPTFGLYCTPMTAIRFGTDGWRGVIAEDFTYANVCKVAYAIARYSS